MDSFSRLPVLTCQIQNGVTLSGQPASQPGTPEIVGTLGSRQLASKTVVQSLVESVARDTHSRSAVTAAHIDVCEIAPNDAAGFSQRQRLLPVLYLSLTSTLKPLAYSLPSLSALQFKLSALANPVVAAGFDNRETADQWVLLASV